MIKLPVKFTVSCIMLLVTLGRSQDTNALRVMRGEDVNGIPRDSINLLSDFALTNSFDTEAELEGLLTDVTDVHTNNDFSIGDYLPTASFDTEAEFETHLTDTTDVITNNDDPWTVPGDLDVLAGNIDLGTTTGHIYFANGVTGIASNGSLFFDFINITFGVGTNTPIAAAELVQTQSSYSTAGNVLTGDALFVENLQAGAGDGNLGGGIAFGTPGRSVQRIGGIVAKQEGADQDTGGLAFYTKAAGGIGGAQVEHAYLSKNGNWTVGDTAIVSTAKMIVDTNSTSFAAPVLQLRQDDIDDSFIDFVGTSAADGSRSISSDTTEDSAKFGALRVEINGVTKWLRVYDDES